jgi:hypothetical protein
MAPSAEPYSCVWERQLGNRPQRSFCVDECHTSKLDRCVETCAPPAIHLANFRAGSTVHWCVLNACASMETCAAGLCERLNLPFA